MKTHLPKAILIALLAGMVQHVSAITLDGEKRADITLGDNTNNGVTVMVSNYVTIGSDVNEECVSVENNTITINGVPSSWQETETYGTAGDTTTLRYDRPYLKDGKDTELLITNVNSTQNHVQSPLYIREGKATIKDSQIEAQLPTQGTALQISGYDASLTFDNSSYTTHVGPALGFLAVGGSDGAGSLSLTNNSNVTISYSLVAGYRSSTTWGLEPDHFTIISPAATSDGHRYQDGQYILADGNRYFGQANISIDKTSTLSMRSRAFLVQANVDVEGVFETDGPIILGRQNAAETVVSISNGGTVQSNQSIRSGDYFSEAEAAKVTITVDGEGSKLKAVSSLDLGYSAKGTTLDVTNNATVTAETMNIGSSIGKQSSVKVTIATGASIEITDTLTLLDDASLIFDLRDTEGNTDLTNLPSLIVGSMEIQNGTIELIFGDISTLENAFGLGTTEAELLSLASSETIDMIDLISFANASSLSSVEDTIVTLKYYDGTELKTYETTSVTIGQIASTSVPEPTTATLSLLALAGLCARRRRK